MNDFLKTWFELQKEISAHSEAVSPFSFCESLIMWSRSLQLSKDIHVKNLHEIYLSNYENLDQSKYPIYQLRNNFNEFLQYDYINQKPKTLERAIILTRDVLWNLISYKSNKECPNCLRDKLRVLTDDSESNIYLSCDECSYTENIKGEKLDADIKLKPATSKLLSTNYPNFIVG